jgi:hypothetical protein
VAGRSGEATAIVRGLKDAYIRPSPGRTFEAGR